MTKAFKKLVAALEAGYLESKKQQDHFFKVLNGRNEEAKEMVKAAFRRHDEIALSDEQQKQGYNWLLNLWLTPTGKERKNNPFGAREIEVLENFNYASLYGWWVQASGYCIPVYRVDGADMSFAYTMIGGGIKIIG